MIYVVVALAAEARPLITHFRLERVEDLPALSVHRRSGLALIVAGVGQEAAASAVEALAQAIPAETQSAWLNVGVAGHREHEIGTAILARQVTDGETGEIYRLSPPEDLHLEIGEICTVRHVESSFPSESLYEMEAAAFCRSAAGMTSSELIQVLKVVSDNRRSGTLCVSARQVQGLVEENLPRVDRLVSSLHRRARHLSR